MRFRQIRGILPALAVVILLLGATGLQATPITIDFGNQGTGGTINVTGCVAGTCANANGSNILISSLEAIIGASDNIYGVSALLSFDTVTNFIRIVGSVPSLNIFNSTLLSGTISSFSATMPLFPNGSLLSVNLQGADTKGPDLLKALGVPGATGFNYFGFTLGRSDSMRPRTTYNAFSTDISNSGQTVPEPAPLMLLGMGMLGLAGFQAFRSKRFGSGQSK